MFCGKCGAENDDSAKVCRECGGVLEGDPSTREGEEQSPAEGQTPSVDQESIGSAAPSKQESPRHAPTEKFRPGHDQIVANVGRTKGDIGRSRTISVTDQSQIIGSQENIQSELDASTTISLVDKSQKIGQQRTIHVEKKEEYINCAVCGTGVSKQESTRCPSCGKLVCPAHYDVAKRLCEVCARTRKAKGYKAIIGAVIMLAMIIALAIGFLKLTSISPPVSPAAPQVTGVKVAPPDRGAVQPPTVPAETRADARQRLTEAVQPSAPPSEPELVPVEETEKPPVQVPAVPAKGIAVLDFVNDTSNLAEIIATDLARSGKLTLVERRALASVLNTQGIDLSQALEPARAKEIGRLTGAAQLLTGSLVGIDDQVVLNARLVDAGTGAVLVGESAEGAKSQLIYIAHQVANRMHYRLTKEWIPELGPKIETAGHSLAELAKIDPTRILPKPDTKLNVDLSLDKSSFSTYRQGSKMQIRFSVNDDCYITLYNIDSQGKVTLLYPNQYHRDNFARKGMAYSIPAPEDQFEFVVRGKGGLESIIAIASTQPLFKYDQILKEQFMPEIDKEASQFLTRAVHVVEREKPKDWTTATVRFYLEPNQG